MIKNRKGQWSLPAVFGGAGLLMLIDAIWIKLILPANRFLEGFIGLLLIGIAIALHRR